MKKNLTLCLIICSIFFSCQKGISWDDLTTSGTASFALQSSATACMNATISGIYTKGIALTSSNKVVVSVNVTAAGTYNIATGTVNGVSFSGSGTFSATAFKPLLYKVRALLQLMELFLFLSLRELLRVISA